jgi:hypothetical protein
LDLVVVQAVTLLLVLPTSWKALMRVHWAFSQVAQVQVIQFLRGCVLHLMEVLGIGTSSPGAKLHVEGSANGLIVGKVVNTNAGASARADMGVVSDSADITMIATSAAYTGVSGWADTGIISTSSGTSGGMLFNVQASAPFRFMQAATNESMRIDSSGNVGIGTSSITSSFKLDVVGVGGARFSNVAGDDGVELGWSAGASAGFVQAYDRGASAFRDLILNNAVTISSSGNLGLGVAPSAWRSGTPAFQVGSEIARLPVFRQRCRVRGSSAVQLLFANTFICVWYIYQQN